MYTPIRNSKGANRDQIVHDRVFFFFFAPAGNGYQPFA